MSVYITTELDLLECNIDDMNPEYYPHLMRRLFNAGARDVWHSPIVMKKGRPGSCLSVLCSPELREDICGIIFSETSTLGVRCSRCERLELSRRIETVETKYGPAKVKTARNADGTLLNAAPENSSCEKLAEQHGLPLKNIYQEVLLAWHSENSKNILGK